MKPPIQIKRPDVAEDIRTLAALTGLSLTDAVATAVRAQLAIERVKSDAALSERKRKSDRIVAGLRRLPIVGPLITDEDLYGRDGSSR